MPASEQNTREGQGYDMVFMGQVEPLKINLDEVDERLARPDYAPVKESLKGIGIGSTLELFFDLCGRAKDLDAGRAGRSSHRRGPAVVLLAGWGINSGAGRCAVPKDACSTAIRGRRAYSPARRSVCGPCMKACCDKPTADSFKVPPAVLPRCLYRAKPAQAVIWSDNRSVTSPIIRNCPSCGKVIGSLHGTSLIRGAAGRAGRRCRR